MKAREKKIFKQNVYESIRLRHQKDREYQKGFGKYFEQLIKVKEGNGVNIDEMREVVKAIIPYYPELK